MDLVQKNAEVTIDKSFEQLKATLKWSTDIDFDLAAIYQKEDDTHGLVYFGTENGGSLTEAPFIQLSEDAGVGDTVDEGGNEEVMTISKFEGIKKLHILCWDYGAVKKGSHARFADSDVSLTIDDNKDQSHKVTLDAGELGNVVCVASIEVSDSHAKLINTSTVGTLKGLTKSEDLINALSLN